MFVLFCIVSCSILLFCIVLEWQAPCMGLYVSFVLDIVHLGILLICTFIELLCLKRCRILNKIVK
jgi:hypothetical protein